MHKHKRLNNSEIASFCGQLSLLLAAGITPYECILLLTKDTVDSRGKALLVQISEAFQSGKSFHEALASTNSFPEYVIRMIILGENSGNLDVVMQNLSDYYEKQNTIAENIRNAISYPLVMICLMLIIMIVLLTKVLPIFNQVFIQLGSELSGISQKLMLIGNSINAASAFLILIIVMLGGVIIILLSTSKGKKLVNHFLHTSRLTRKFYLNIAYGRFASGLAMTLSSGMDTYHSLDITENLVNNELMKDKIAVCRKAISEGGSLPEALSSAEIFSAIYTRMLQVGYRSGSVDIVLKKIAVHYEEETDNRLHSILSAVEPTLVILFSLMVGLILMSVIMPLIGIMSSIG